MRRRARWWRCRSGRVGKPGNRRDDGRPAQRDGGGRRDRGQTATGRADTACGFPRSVLVLSRRLAGIVRHGTASRGANRDGNPTHGPVQAMQRRRHPLQEQEQRDEQTKRLAFRFHGRPHEGWSVTKIDHLSATLASLLITGMARDFFIPRAGLANGGGKRGGTALDFDRPNRVESRDARRAPSTSRPYGASMNEPRAVRARILDAALHILQESGLRSLSQAKVAAAAGIRQSHLQYYFPKKIDLVIALLRGHTPPQGLGMTGA